MVNLTALEKPIALGRTAEIYAWQEGQVLKLFREWVTAGAVEYEARIARAVLQTGIHAPAVVEMVQVGGRLGLVYTRVGGEMLISSLRRQPWTFGKAALLLAQQFIYAYLKGYFAIHPGNQNLLSQWIPVVAAARLSEGIAEEEANLLALAGKVR